MKQLTLITLAGLALSFASCQTPMVEETFVRADIADTSAPDWVKGRIETMAPATYTDASALLPQPHRLEPLTPVTLYP